MPEENLPRRQAAIVFDRLAKKYNLYAKLPVLNPMFVAYQDVNNSNNEVLEAIK